LPPLRQAPFVGRNMSDAFKDRIYQDKMKAVSAFIDKIKIMDVNTRSKIKKMSPQFLVADIQRSVEFYTKKLGFEIDFRYEDFYVGIIKDDFSIHLKTGQPLVDVRQNKMDSEHLDITFSIEGIEYFYDELSSKAVEIIQPLRKMPYGREFYVADPDGYIIAFLEEV
jgi:catechol 2,3-dioxygenase-like lactoylglutathione lyase family enzyme